MKITYHNGFTEESVHAAAREIVYAPHKIDRRLGSIEYTIKTDNGRTYELRTKPYPHGWKTEQIEIYIDGVLAQSSVDC